MSTGLVGGRGTRVGVGDGVAVGAAVGAGAAVSVGVGDWHAAIMPAMSDSSNRVEHSLCNLDFMSIPPGHTNVALIARLASVAERAHKRPG